MAAVDPDADVEVVKGRDSVIARIPLAEAPGPWIKEYVSLARAEDLAAEVREEHGRIPPVVQVLPASRIGKPSQYWTRARHFTLATVDRTAAATATEQQIRKWWELQRGDAAL